MTPEPTPAPPDAEPPPAPRRWKRFAGRVLLVAGLTLAGVGIGTAAKLAVKAPEVAEVEAPAPVVLPPATDAERIDAAVRVGDFAAGLAACIAAPRTAFGGHEGPLVYREALCLEGLGRAAEAADLYTKAAGEYATPAVWGWAVLGQARCAAPRDPAAAGRFVSQAVLASGGAPELLDECLHARARLAVAAVKPATPPDPLDPTALAWPAAGDDLAGSGGRLLPAALPARPDAPVPVVVSRPLFHPTRVLVTGRLRERAGADLIRAVAAVAGLGVRIDPGAAAKLPAAGAALDVAGAPLAEVLTALTDPHGVGWAIDGADLRVGTAVPPGRADAEAALGRALQTAPDHPTAGAARLALANLHAAAGRARDAADGYRRLIAGAATTPEAVPAAYNLGLTELRAGHVAAARGRFTEVIDRAGPGTKWAALGWWWVGRAHLDVGETGPAAKALRSAGTGPGAEVVSASTLGLILCHLTDGDGETARELLLDYRPARVEKHRAAAAAFSTLLRYRVAPSAGRAEAAAAALAAAGDGEAFGPSGALFTGRAYAELGRHDRATAVYEAAAARARGPVAVRMTFAVADRYAELGLAAPARQRYLAVAALDPHDLGPRAELRLAELAADAGNADECVRRCRALLARPGAERAAVLAVLGRGYELAGRYRDAATAFAGQVPAE